ncbi:PREDICTED: uncharacterized protein LOC105971086 [Erythranthe guttata]|uniref:uncharacterized protein LOC105971086 n=1 Tax=Erythranthe guttata TaxID=4155 RepID=UPI00064DE700|nr:PREDICTED: uncharacterized protein LOC105971086 [Erythranthe guttata]|eukprot:XP_012851387.1 PREDICTED: uncharacterized protein LOC105971086 [Erythranthe guttata]
MNLPELPSVEECDLPIVDLGQLELEIAITTGSRNGQRRMRKNHWIEEWATKRENLEHHFRWTRRNLALAGIFGIAVPVLVYKGIVKDFVFFFLSWPPSSLTMI